MRLRQRVTKAARGLALAYKLLRMDEGQWRRLDGARLLPLVRAAVPFVDGVMQERPDAPGEEAA